MARIGLGLVLAAWGLLLLAWLSLHWFILPHIERWRPQLESRASRALGVTVRIGSVSVQSSGWVPAIELRDVELLDAEQRVALKLAKVSAALSLRSLVTFELQFEQLLIDGAQLDVRRDVSGRISVAGLDFGSGAGGDDNAAADWFFKQHEFVIRGGALRWIDEQRQAAPLVLGDVQIVIRNGLRHHDFRLDATPPASWGERFTLRALFRQPLLAHSADWRRWSGSVYADLPRADLRELRRHVALPFELSEGDGALRGWFAVREGQPRAATVDLALRAVTLRLDPHVEALAFEQIEGRLVAERERDRSSIELRHFGFLTGDGIRWPVGDMNLAWKQPQGQDITGGAFSAEHLDIGLMAQIAARVPLGAALRKLLVDVHPEGSVSGLKTAWQGPLDAPERYQVSGLLSGLTLAPGAAERADAVGRPGLRNATLQLQANEAGGKAHLSMRDGTLQMPGVFADPALPLEHLDAQLAWQVEPAKAGGRSPVAVQVKNASFSNRDATGELSASWHTGPVVAATGAASAASAPDERFPGRLELDGKLSDAVATRTVRYLPLGLPDGTRHYIERALRGGTLPSVSIHVKGDLADFPFRHTPGSKSAGELRVDVKLEGVTFAYVPGATAAPVAANGGAAVRAGAAGAAISVGTPVAGGAVADHAFAPAWPPATALSGELIIDGSSLEIHDARAMLGGVEWTHLNGRIPQLGDHAVLALEGTGHGALADMLRFVNGTPVGTWTGKVLAPATGSGSADVKLALGIPLDDQAGESSVKGSLVLPGNDVRMSPGTPLLGNTRARVDFTQKGFAIANATARVLGGDLAFEGGSQGGEGQRFSGQGTVSAEALRRATELGVVSRAAGSMTGQATYRANLSFVKGLSQLAITSNLVGMALDLPYPLAKAAAAPLALRYQTSLDAESLAAAKSPRETLLFELGNALQARYVRDLSGDEPRVVRGALRLGDGAGPLSAPPVDVSAPGVSAHVDLRQLDIDAWQAALEKIFGDGRPDTRAGPAVSAASVAGIPGASVVANVPNAVPNVANVSALNGVAIGPAPAVSTGASSGYQPDRVALRVLELKSGTRRFKDVVIGATEQAGVWRANVDADQLAGYVELRLPHGNTGEGAGRVYARLSRLSVPKGEADHGETLLDQQPASVPSLDVVADEFVLGGRNLGRLEIVAANRIVGSGRDSSREWQMSKFNLATPEAQLTATGTWSTPAGPSAAVAPAGAASAERRAAMNFKLDLRDSGALLERFGMSKVIRGGKGQLVGDISWPGSPLAPDIHGMQGQINVAIDAGQFLKAGPGAARLLGVLSLQSLPRRFSFDFRDLFQDGFAFDNIVGDVRIGAGLATTNNLRMRGVAAAVLMEGSANLDHETEDLRVVVVPEINAGTASLAYAIINPAIGLGTFLAQYLLRKPLMAASTREFHVTGPWDDPKVERVEHRATEEATLESPPAAPAAPPTR